MTTTTAIPPNLLAHIEERARAARSTARTSIGCVRAATQAVRESLDAIRAARGRPLRDARPLGRLVEAERRTAGMPEAIARLAALEAKWAPGGIRGDDYDRDYCRMRDLRQQTQYDDLDDRPVERTQRRDRLNAVAAEHGYEPLTLTVREVRRAGKHAAFRRQLLRRQRLGLLALHVARRHHHTVRALYRSRRATIIYGIGTTDRAERGVYSKRWHRNHGPCRWTDAGVMADEGRVITLYPVVGHALSLPPVPAALVRAWLPDAPHPVGLLAARTADPDIVAAWAPVEGRWRVVGLCWRGRVIAQRVAARQYAAADVLAEPDQEVRAAMVGLYPGGAERYIADAGLSPVQQDDYGRLYELPGGAARVVEVVNATAEPDGTHRRHWLTVPPSVRTAHDAVAWTFGRGAADYAPEAQA